MAAEAAPTALQKLVAELLGTACLVYVGAGSAAATGVIAATTKEPFSMAQLGMISFAFMLVIVGVVEAIGTAILVFVIFGVIDHRAVPGWAPMAIGSAVFAIIIILGPATGAAINPARYLGAIIWQSAFGGTVHWSQAPAYLLGELAGGVLGGLAYMALSRTRTAGASLAPTDPDDSSAPSPSTSKISEGAS